jgi:hypothetical protein
MTEETAPPGCWVALDVQRHRPVWRGRGGPARAGVRLTEENRQAVQAWMRSWGVVAVWTSGPYPRLSWGGRLGSYNVEPGCWVALSLGEAPGLPAAFDAYVQQSWDHNWERDQ